MRFVACPFALLVAVALCGPIAQSTGGETVDYASDIKPTLRARCFACHGALKQEAGLRLDTGESIRAGGDSGPAVLSGQPAESLILERVAADDEFYRMPPEGEALSDDEIAAIEAWISQGAQSPSDELPEEDPRQHWAFRRPVRPTLPAGDGSQHPIDRLIAQSYERHQLTPQSAASRSAILRRVYLDLIGLPPTRAELVAFLSDESPDAYEQVVDRLLASPRYGERWARHWMDVWRYSDWYGRRMVPDVWNSAPQIWRWRDWIVQSLNDDRGYDQMVCEMLAGDELEPFDEEASYATGFLVRNWYALNPNDWMRSNVEHTAKAFLGLTFNCAHCHDHKYDPIAQEDYFRLRAFFEPIDLRQDRVAGEADPGLFQEYDYSTLRKIVRLGAVRVYDKQPDASTWFYTGGDERNRVTERGSIAPGVPAFLADVPLNLEPVALPPHAWYPGFRPAIQETVLAELRAAVDAGESKLATASSAAFASTTSTENAAEPGKTVRVEEGFPITVARQRAALAELASAEARMAADRARYGDGEPADATNLSHAAHQAEHEAAVCQAEVNVLVAQEALALTEAKPAEDEQRAAEIESATKAVADAQSALDAAQTALADRSTPEAYTPLSPVYPATSTGRRRALAAWITHEANPLPARVAINHIWLRHFHAPLVATVFDFGRSGAQPTHPELLDWLAVELVDSGWSMKHIHRLIVTSATYRLASNVGDSNASNQRIDPENKLLWRMNVGRMEAEVLRDSLLYCAGQLDLTQGGQELENSEALTTHRRTLYYSCHPELDGRSQFGALFDAPEPTECYRRTRSVIPQQALALTNSELVHELSHKLAAELWQTADDATPDASVFVNAVYETILARRPTPEELAACCEYLNPGLEPDDADQTARRRASLVRAVLNHNDFIAIR